MLKNDLFRGLVYCYIIRPLSVPLLPFSFMFIFMTLIVKDFFSNKQPYLNLMSTKLSPNVTLEVNTKSLKFNINNEDIFICPGNLNGNYTLKYGYLWLLRDNHKTIIHHINFHHSQSWTENSTYFKIKSLCLTQNVQLSSYSYNIVSLWFENFNFVYLM